MTATTQHDRDFWHDILLSGGQTALPRWTPDPRPGSARCEVLVADEVASAIRDLAAELDVPVGSVFLAAHAKVLGSLTGEHDVTTGYMSPDVSEPLPCRMAAAADSWRTLLLDSHRAEAELLSHRGFAVAELARELHVGERAFETVFDPCDITTDLVDGIALAVSFARRDDQTVMNLHYRTDVVDAAGAARVAGYHLTALGLMVADPGAAPGPQSLVSDEELRFQIEDLAGPDRELPDRRFHQLFEKRVELHPDRIAAVSGDRQWTYRELNARANRLARALLARGSRRETVVAVVTERNLDWMATVLAVFKAGAVYLPIEPHFPADRIAATLERSGCCLVVTETGSTATLDEALVSQSDVETLYLDAAYEEGHADDDLGVDVGFDQLAYIYFTSGSTGQPKGAMCEHGGMLNHLYAKIDDFEIGEGEVVAQVAPQCFDISLWQLVSALLVGGRTLLVEQEAILDPRRFIDTITAGDVAVLQVVPSYLEVLLSYLDQEPRELTSLHCVSVTGEAVTLELVQRWFATEPAIKLANAYGLTETSDDTNHEVMQRAPEDGSVPLGRAINNVSVRVVDEEMRPVPLGAPGEIVFSGVCVGRGYVNDPDRTRAAYTDDPLADGQRLYRSGDYGRWRPDGKLEFLGRRDAQVKIRGFRIEIGEIENTMLGGPGVRGAAVVVTERPDGSKHLVGYYTGRKIEVDSMQDRLGQTLPEYMVPTVIHHRESLPLTGNGKVDKKALRALAAELDVAEAIVQVPSTETEHYLAAEWAKVLAVPADQLGRHDNFFDRGGTSLSAVQLVIALDGAVSLKDVTRTPVLADLARLIDGSSAPQAELMQLLSDPDEAQVGALVCFPYAGGNAVNFQAMARSLRGSGLAVLAVELPGHDLAGAESFASFDRVVEQVVDEIVGRDLRNVLLWGHSLGAAFAVETARRALDLGVDVRQVFVGAQLLGDVADRRAHVAELGELTDTEITADLITRGGYGDIDDLDELRAEHVGAAYRHDCRSAHDHLIEEMQSPRSSKLPVPLTVVVAADDQRVTGWQDQFLDWELVAERVDVHELVDGGHYFLRTRPDEAAQVVLRVAGSVTST